MQSPIPVITILASYLYFVLKLGPQWMARRKPFEIQPLLVAYNGYQVLFSIWLCCQAFKVDIKYLLRNGCIQQAENKALATAVSKIPSKPYKVSKT